MYFLSVSRLSPMWVTLTSSAVPVQIRPNTFLEQLRPGSAGTSALYKVCSMGQQAQCSQRMCETIPFTGVTFQRHQKASLNYVFSTGAFSVG